MPESLEETLSRLRREQWQPIRDAHQSVHRGLGMELSDEDHAVVHDPTRPMHERAARLMQHVAQGHTREDYGWGGDLGGSGLGVHWTTDSNVAHHFAKIEASHRQKFDEDADPRHGHNADGFPRQRPETRVVLHAHFPEHEHIAHEVDDQDGAFGWDVRNQLQHTENGGGVPGGYEREVPIKRGQPVKVHAISWGLASHRHDDPAPHDSETTRYDFPETQHHQAMRYVRNPQSSAAHGDFGEQHAVRTASTEVYYHGTHAQLGAGDLIHPGHGGSEHEFAFATRSLRHATDFAFEHGPAPHVYRVAPTGPHEYVPLARGEVRSKHPYRVIDELPHHEYLDEESLAEVPPEHRTASRTPTQRIFGPTHGLDHRLWDGDHLKHDVSAWVMEILDGFWRPVYGPTWRRWSRVYFAGSEASEWTSETQEGNNDFDVLIGIDYERMRSDLGGLYQMMDDEQITNALNKQLTTILWPRLESAMIPVDGQMVGPVSATFFVNQDSWDIRDIKPYAAYCISTDKWAVRPPHLPDWSIKDFPPAFVKEARAVEAYVRAVLALPEPMRAQQADALWRHLHGDRSRAFSAQGEGWYDPGNALEKWLDQAKGTKGASLWETLAEAHFEAQAHPEELLAPSDWSNTPPIYS